MRPKRLSCQDCGLKFDSMSAYKKHSRKNGHQQQVAELFQTAPYCGSVHFPNFVVLEYLSKLKRGYPVIGLQLVSLCISTETTGPTFYLCHVCQEKCPGGTMLSHLTSTEHYFSVFTYTNPELLQFGWLPPPESVPGLKRKAEVLEKQLGTGVLKVIDIPKKVFENMKMSPYAQTMKELTHSEKLREACLGDQPGRVTLQEYLKSPERTHPLLGLQFLVEYRPADSSKLCGYLCLLCKKRVKDAQVIAHVIGFDHLFWYLDLVHPSSLASKSSYQQYSEKHRSQILDLAKQAQELGTSGEVQEVKLDPAVFAAVDCGSYAKALELLQEVRKERNQSDFWPLVTPGQRLVIGTYQRMKPPGVPPVIVQKTFPESQTVPVKEMVQSPSAPQEHIEDPQHTDTESDQTAVSAGQLTNFGISCQDCGPGARYAFISEYKKHARGSKHKQRVESLFRTVPVPSLVVYENLGKPHRTAPVIGLQLVTACIDTETADPPMYLCHVCHTCTSHSIMTHLTSSDHYLNALAFMSPHRLPFGWMLSQDMLSSLTPRVKAEEKQRGPGMLQVLDMPKETFQMIRQTPYFASMRILCQTEELKERLRVKKLVTLQEYLSNPKRKHPMLGLQFLVEYRPANSSKLCGYLCLLCKKRVEDAQVIAHVIGFDHLFWYLDLAHPSSLACKSHYKQYDAEYRTMILDLAKQAEQIDSSGKVKVMTVDPTIYEEVESSDFTMALSRLQTIWREQNQSDLQPLVTPGERLVPKKPKSTQSSELQQPIQSSDPQKPAQTSELQNLAQSSEPQEPVPSLEGRNLPHSSDLQRPGQSSELLWSYLKSKERKEPVIGLEAVIECASSDLPPYYLCVACAEKMPQACIIDHLISPSHRYLYLKSHHLLSGWEETADLTKMITPLKERAAALEQEKGYGEAQVLELEATQYKEVIASSIDVALNSLRTIQEKQNQSDLRPLESPGEGREGLVKEDELQSQVTPSNQNSQSTVTVREEIAQSPGVEGPAFDLKCMKKSWVLGEQSQTQASKVLWRYLKNRQRREPIIGLCDIIEHESDKQPSFLECKACAKTFRADFIIGHVIGSRHRYSYIRSKHPELLEGWRENPDLTGNIQKLQAMAKVLEHKEGWGQFEVMKVKPDAVREAGPTSTDKENPIQESRPFQEPDAQGRSNFALTHLVKKKKKGTKQPIIGLREVTECCAINQQMFYICDICFAKISKNHILQHVTGDLHRCNYIKSQYPSLVKRDVKKPNLTESLSDYFLNLARVVVQMEKGVGDVQIMELDVDLCKELLSMPDDSAVSKLKKIREERNQKKDVMQQGDMKHRLPSASPEPAPEQPSLSLPPSDSATGQTGKRGEATEAQGSVDNRKETVVIKQEPVESAAALQEPDSTEPKTATMKQEKLESQMSCEESQESQCPEEPVQDPKDTEPEVEETVATLLAPSEQNQDQKRTDTEAVTATEDQSQSPGPPEKHVPDSRGAETKANESGVAACEEVRWQVSPHISLQCPRNTATKRAAVPVGESHLAKFMLPFLTNKPEPLVGLRAVVECRSFKQPTFYLCLTCAEKINKNQMCNHIISGRHQHRYIESRYPKLLPHFEKNPADVAWWVEDRERIWDAQVMKLDLKSYEQVASAPFDTALGKLQAIRREQNQADLRPLVSPGERLVVVHKWRILHQEAPQKPLQELDSTQSQKVDSSEEKIQHRVTSPDMSSSHQSASVSGKRVQSPAPAQKPSLNVKDTETQREEYLYVDEEEAAERGGVWQVPVRESQGAEPTKERTFRPPPDLRGYVEDPQRSQPVVGLSALIECRSESQPPLYLCVACSTLLSKTLVISHVISRKHLLSYLKAKRPDLYSGWSDSQDLAKMSKDLMEMAREAEREEPARVREIQEVSLDSAAYAEVKSMSFDKALALLLMIQKEQNRTDLRLCITPEPRRVTVKQETVESQVFPEEPTQDPKEAGTQPGTVKVDRDQRQAAQEPVQHPKSPEREGGVREEKQPPVQMESHHKCHSGSTVKTPLIGLKVVIECRNVEGQPPARFYLCRACSDKLTGDQQSVSKHVGSPLHQYCYIKSHHSRRLEMEKKAGSLTCGLTDLVQFVAKKLEEEEGSGSIQVINMPEAIFNRLIKGTYESCMKMLKGCDGVEERQTGSSQGNGSITLHTATRGSGRTLQRSDSGSDTSCNSPVSQGPPIKSSRHPLANIRNHKEGCQRPRSPGDVATHHPLIPRGRPSPDPVPPHRPGHLSCKASEPQSRSPCHPLVTHSPPRPTNTPLDSLSYRPDGITEPAGTHHPSPAVGPSHGTDTRRSAAIEGRAQGAQISTVPLLYSRAADRQLTAGGAVKQKFHRERSKDDHPWNYENRQFSPDFSEPGAGPQEKRSRVACDGKGSAQTAHVPQVGAETQRASGGRCRGNIVIDSRTAPGQESLASQGGHGRGVREPSKAVCGAGGHSRTGCLMKSRPSEDRTRRPTPPLSSSSGRVPEKVSVLGKRLRQSSETQQQADSKPSDSDSPPVKIRGLDCGDSVENPAVKLLTCWKQITGGERRA